MTLGELFLEAMSTGVITNREMAWVTAQQDRFSRTEEAVAQRGQPGATLLVQNFPLHLIDEIFGLRRRHRLVPMQMHRITAPALRPRS